MSLNQTVEEGVKVVEGETAVHAPLRPARGVVGAVHVVVLGPGQVLRVLPEVIQVTSAVRSQTTDLPFRSCWVEDNVVDGLDELQLDDALYSQHCKDINDFRTRDLTKECTL